MHEGRKNKSNVTAVERLHAQNCISVMLEAPTVKMFISVLYETSYYSNIYYFYSDVLAVLPRPCSFFIG